MDNLIPGYFQALWISPEVISRLIHRQTLSAAPTLDAVLRDMLAKVADPL